jgi:hypothetical protein
MKNAIMGTSYETDIIAWANEQAALLCAGRLSDLDIAHIADEIDDVGKSERRELAADDQGAASAIAAHLRETPSLKTSLADPIGGKEFGRMRPPRRSMRRDSICSRTTAHGQSNKFFHWSFILSERR